MIERLAYSKVDTHGGHSTRSDGTNSPQELYRLAQEAGLAFFVTIDHDVWEPFKIDSEFPVLFGVELTTGEGHIVGLFPEGPPRERIQMGLSAEDSIKTIQGNGGKAILAHPEYWFFFISTTFNTIRRLKDKGIEVDGMEVMHPALDENQMLRNIELATELQIPQVGVSDNHDKNIGRGYVTYYPRATEDPIQDFFDALDKNQTRPGASGLPRLPVTLKEKAIRHTRGPSTGLKEKWERKGVFASTWKSFMYQTIYDRLNRGHNYGR